ncbi:hypothetical protein [Corallococcus carmarthensis]|nr:hypothetical protein [Corallococcus carmarthensis]
MLGHRIGQRINLSTPTGRVLLHLTASLTEFEEIQSATVYALA